MSAARDAVVRAIDATNRESTTWPKNMTDAEAYGRFADAILAALTEVGLDRRDTSDPTPDSPGTEPAGTETEGSCR